MPVFETVMGGKSAPIPSSCQAGEVRAVEASYTCKGTEVATDVIHMVWLPAEHVPVDVILITDAQTAGAADVGITDDPIGTTEDADAFLAAQSLATAAVVHANKVAGMRLAPVANNRRVGLTVTTNITGTNVVTLRLTYRSQQTYEIA